jgi:hypothetical protein
VDTGELTVVFEGLSRSGLVSCEMNDMVGGGRGRPGQFFDSHDGTRVCKRCELVAGSEDGGERYVHVIGSEQSCPHMAFTCLYHSHQSMLLCAYRHAHWPSIQYCLAAGPGPAISESRFSLTSTLQSQFRRNHVTQPEQEGHKSAHPSV